MSARARATAALLILAIATAAVLLWPVLGLSRSRAVTRNPAAPHETIREDGRGDEVRDPPEPPRPNPTPPRSENKYLRVHVIDSLGSDVEGATVTALVTETVPWDERARTAGTARTGTRGWARIPAHGPQLHEILVTHPRMFETRTDAWPEHDKTIELAIKGPPRLVIRATDTQTGEALPIPLLYRVATLKGARESEYSRGTAVAPLLLYLPNASRIRVEIGARGYRYVIREYVLSEITLEDSVELPPAAICDGVVVDAKTQRAIPRARCWTGGRFGDGTTADYSGRFRVHGMVSVAHDGPFTVWAQAPGYGLGQIDIASEGGVGIVVGLPPLRTTQVFVTDAATEKHVAGTIELRRLGRTQTYSVGPEGAGIGLERDVVYRVRTRADGYADGFAVCLLAAGDTQSLGFVVGKIVKVRIRLHRGGEPVVGRRFTIEPFAHGVAVHAKGERNRSVAGAVASQWKGVFRGVTNSNGIISLRLGAGERHRLRLGNVIPDLTVIVPLDRAVYDIVVDETVFE